MVGIGGLNYVSGILNIKNNRIGDLSLLNPRLTLGGLDTAMTNITDYTPLNSMTFLNNSSIHLDIHRLIITKMSASSDYCNDSNGTISFLNYINQDEICEVSSSTNLGPTYTKYTILCN